jgi:hypothetical protein
VGRRCARITDAPGATSRLTVTEIAKKSTGSSIGMHVAPRRKRKKRKTKRKTKRNKKKSVAKEKKKTIFIIFPLK